MLVLYISARPACWVGQTIYTIWHGAVLFTFVTGSVQEPADKCINSVPMSLFYINIHAGNHWRNGTKSSRLWRSFHSTPKPLPD